MKKDLSKKEAEKEIEKLFSELKLKNPKQIRKAKRLAMKFNIPLKEKRKLFCQNCYSAYRKPKIRIKNKIKTIVCENCGNISRWKLN